jgi:lipopolysaccharide transport system ATP-binding protein
MNAIEIHDIGKKYNIGDLQVQHETIAEAALDMIKRPFRRGLDLLRGNATGAADMSKEFWALRHISLAVEEGETVGIIGRNGSGKSTLLKVLSRITDPTEGYARINGRVGSLLEVGTGFNLELTGRENVYLNGSILGMTIKEIDSKFNQIVEFAGIEEFMDTPAKHYSSGMKVRLAFSVAAHLDPEILLIDEVLAVGDYAFQKKSLGKMKDVTKGGRTVLFVSHQLDMVREICERVVLLNAGNIEMVGAADEVIDYYIKSFGEESTAKTSFSCEPEEKRPFQFLAGRVLNGEGEESASFDMFEPITIEYDYLLREDVEGIVVAAVLHRNGTPLVISWDTDAQPELLEKRSAGTYRSRVTLPVPFLKEGQYSVEATIAYPRGRGEKQHKLYDALQFEVILTSRAGSLVSYSNNRRGTIALELPWQTEALKEKLGI